MASNVFGGERDQNASKKAIDAMPRFMKVTPINNLVQSFNFVVTINEYTFGFQEVSGIDFERRVGYVDEGGVNDHQIMLGEPNYDTKELKFRRGLMLRAPSIVTNAIMAAASAVPTNLGRRIAMTAALMTDPQASLEQGPSLMTIQVFGTDKQLKALYTTVSLGMTHWSLDSLEAGKSDVLVEEFTIVHIGLNRHPVTFSTGNVIWSQAVQSASAEKQAEAARLAEEQQKKADELRKLEQEAQKKKQEELKAQREAERKKRELEQAEKNKDAIEEQKDKNEEERKKREEETKAKMEEQQKAQQEKLEEQRKIMEERAKQTKN